YLDIFPWVSYMFNDEARRFCTNVHYRGSPDAQVMELCQMVTCELASRKPIGNLVYNDKGRLRSSTYSSSSSYGGGGGGGGGKKGQKRPGSHANLSISQELSQDAQLIEKVSPPCVRAIMNQKSFPKHSVRR